MTPEENRRRQAALFRALHGPHEPEVSELREPERLDFDGGARQTAPEPGDPEAEHGEFLLEVIRRRAESGGGSW